MEIALDELSDRDMVAIQVIHVATLGVGRDDQQRNTGSVAEEVYRLNVARVVVTAAFVLSDEDRGAGPDFRLRLHSVDDVLDEAFEQFELRRRGMTVGRPAGLHDRN